MRITQSMLSDNMLRNINNSYRKLGTYQNQLSTQKKISKPSDDPVIAFKGIGYRTNVVEVEQYKRNMNEVNVWLENTEDALDQTNAAVQRISELVVNANNKTLTDDDRQKIESEVEQLKQQVISLANTKINGKYIFNGSKVYGTVAGQPPVADDGTTNFTNDSVSIEVSSGIKLDVNTSGSMIFEDLIKDIQSLQNKLGTGNEPDLALDITNMQKNLETINSSRSTIGATMNRVDLISNRLGSLELISNKMVSKNEDIEVEEVILQFKTQESVHQAALSVGSKIIQNSLVDFIR